MFGRDCATLTPMRAMGSSGVVVIFFQEMPPSRET